MTKPSTNDRALDVLADLRSSRLTILDSKGRTVKRLALDKYEEAKTELMQTVPTTIDGVLALLRYVTGEDRNGTDLNNLSPVLRNIERGLRQIRKTSI